MRRDREGRGGDVSRIGREREIPVAAPGFSRRRTIRSGQAFGHHRGGELVAASGNGDDITRAISQCLPQQRDMLRQIVFLNVRFRPDGFENLLLGHYTPWIVHQAGEHFKGLWQKRHRLAVPQERSPRTTQFELVKPVLIV